MTAIEAVRHLMTSTGTTLTELTEYSDMGTKSNVCRKLSGRDLKVSAFVKMLETMGCELMVQTETGESIQIDYDYN